MLGSICLLQGLSLKFLLSHEVPSKFLVSFYNMVGDTNIIWSWQAW